MLPLLPSLDRGPLHGPPSCHCSQILAQKPCHGSRGAGTRVAARDGAGLAARSSRLMGPPGWPLGPAQGQPSEALPSAPAFSGARVAGPGGPVHAKRRGASGGQLEGFGSVGFTPHRCQGGRGHVCPQRPMLEACHGRLSAERQSKRKCATEVIAWPCHVRTWTALPNSFRDSSG
jgi:hypothetical protein